jgi:hypothetical protein
MRSSPLAQAPIRRETHANEPSLTIIGRRA